MNFKKAISLIMCIGIMLSASASAEVFYEESETTKISDGLKHTHLDLYTSTGWQNVDVLEADFSNPYISAEVLTSDEGIGYAETLTNLAENSIGAVNADFFARNSWTKASSMGLMVEGGNLISTATKDINGATIGIDKENKVFLDYVKTDVIFTSANGESITIKDINKYDSLKEPCIYTKEFSATTEGSFNNVIEVVVTDGTVTDIRREKEGVEIPENGYVIRHLPEFDPFFAEKVQIGDKVTLTVNTSLDITNLKSATGGGTLLVKNGQKHEITHRVDGANPRTMAGTDKTGTKLYLVTVEGRVSGSAGMTLSELQDLALRLGMDTAINLDGGGSTTMVARNNKTSNNEIVNALSDGSQRTIPSGLGIVSSAPKGKPETLVLKTTESVLFNGTSRKIEIEYVLDEYGNPCDMPSGEISYTATGGTMNKNVFTANKSGKAVVNVSVGNASGSIELDVLETPIYLETLPKSVTEGEDFKIYGVDENGNKALIEKEECDIKSFKRHYTLTFGKAQAVLYKVSSNAEKFETEIATSWAYPEGVASSKYSLSDNAMSGKYSGKLEFAFKDSGEVQAAYLNFSAPKKVPVGKNVLGVWVYAPCENYQWLRGEGQTESGDTVRITLNESMEFSGWKYLTAKIPVEMKTLDKLYVVQNKVKGNISSYILLDDLEFMEETADIPYLQPKVKMTEGLKGVTVSVSVETLPRNTLLSRLYDVALQNSINTSGANINIDLNIPTSFENGSVKGMVLASNDKGITGADSTQWQKFFELAETDTTTLIVGVPQKLSELPNRQGEIIRKTLEKSAKQKQVILVQPGKTNTVERENGVTIISVAGYKFNNKHMFIDQMKYMSFGLITASGKDLNVEFKRVYK